MKNYIKLFVFYSLLTSLLLSCATRKRKGEVGGLKKFYHNVTAKYNGYFNANEIMKETYATIEDTHQDNYNDLLPVYPFVKIDPQNYEGELDRAIEKVTTVATIHDVSDWVDDCYVLMGTAQFLKQDYETAQETFEFFQEEFNPNDPSSRNYKKKKKTAEDRKKEREEERKIEKKKKEEERKAKQKAREEENKKREEERKRKEKEREREKDARKRKIEDRRKAAKEGRGAKQRAAKEKALEADSTSTNEAINVVKTPGITENPQQRPKVAEDNAQEYTPEEKKKEKVKTENTAYHEGILWLSRTYIERQRYSSADFLLRQMWDNPAVKKDVRKEIPAAQAHSFIKQKKYNKAKEYLVVATEIAKHKEDRARYAYILAQLEERDRNFTSARKYYARSKKLGSVYEMELNSELNMIKNNLLANKLSNQEGEDKLLDMRSENKNDEHRDRISFVLAQVAIAQPDLPKAENYFKEALQYSSNNNDLSTESYYALGQMNYNRGDFVTAKNYFDSTLQVIRKNDPRINEVNRLAKSLQEIAKNIETIYLQDSLIRIGALPEANQIEYAKNVLATSHKDNAKDKDVNIQESDKNSITSKIRRAKKSRARNLVRSDFFAYDQNEVRKGIEAFRERWGDRTLQDNWRRKEALRVSAELRNNVEETAEGSEDENNQDAEIKEILKRLPKDSASIGKAEKLIENAYFELGKLYRDDLKKYDKSIESYTTLLSRFPKTDKKLEVYYNLHLTYLEIPDMRNAEKYKDLLIKEFPDTKFAKVLSDPAYAAALMDKDRNLNQFYDEMFNAFNRGAYEQVIDLLGEGEDKFGKNHSLRPKFGLLEAMAKGKTEGEGAYISALQDVIKRYPRTPEQTRAREILRFLKGDENAFDAINIDAVDDIFELEEKKLHYLIVIVYDAIPKIFDEAKIAVSDFNKKHHAIKRLQLADIPLNKSNNTSIILVRKFSNKEKVMDYYRDVIKKKNDFIPNSEINYDVYSITQRNYRKMLEQKSSNQYRLWFQKHYLQENQNTPNK